MDLDSKLKGYLTNLGRQTVKTVRKLTEGSIYAVYIGELNFDNNLELMEKYEDAVDAVKEWITAVLHCEFMGNKGITEARVKLYLPDRPLEVSVNMSNMPRLFNPLQGGMFDPPYQSEMHMPIGEIDYFTYRAIVEVQENPVKELYSYFQSTIYELRGMVRKRLGGQTDWLNEELLDKAKVTDELGLAKYDYMWGNLIGMFSNQLYGGFNTAFNNNQSIFEDTSVGRLKAPTYDPFADGGEGDSYGLFSEE